MNIVHESSCLHLSLSTSIAESTTDICLKPSVEMTPKQDWMIVASKNFRVALDIY